MKQVFTKLFTKVVIATVLGMFFVSSAFADTVTLVSGSGTSGYGVPEGWTTSGTVEGGSYLKFDNGTITSPEFAAHTGLSFTYAVATFGSGDNHPLTIRILNASTNAVIVEKTTATPTSSSYISPNSPLSLGDVNVAFKIQMYAPTGKGVRLRNYSITGTPSSSSVSTITSISTDGITNTDVHISTAAGSLSASVTANGNPVVGATVTWSGNNDAVATINSNTGAVTLVSAGTVKFTALYAGVDGEYKPSSDEYTMTVTSSAPYVQPTTFDINLNDGFFETSYNGTASGITDSSPVSGTKDNVTVTYAGSGNHYINDSQIRFYPNNKLTFDAPSGYEIKKIVFTSAGTWDATISADPGVYTSDSKTWEGTASSVVFSGSGSSRCDMSKVTITLGEPSPVIHADDVSIEYDVTSGYLTYTIDNEPDPVGVLTASIKSGDWLSLGTVSTTVPFTCFANSVSTERSATVTLTYTYGSNKTVSKDVTVTQAAMPYSTIPNLFAAATNTATTVKVLFDNWVVSGVSTNGKNVFVTDNSGNGFVIYNSDGGLNNDYSVGDILTGTAECELVLYYGFAEITGLNASDLTITSGGTVSISNINLANLAGVNTGALVSYESLTCSIDNNKYYLSDGTTTLQVYNTLYAFSALEAGKHYNITGIYQQFNSTKEILPRSSEDIVEVVLTIPGIIVTPTSIADFTYAEGDGPSAPQSFTVSGENLTADIGLSLGESDFEMSLSENSGYTNSLTLAQNSGVVSETSVYVRLKAGKTKGTYSGSISLTSTGATERVVSLSGNVAGAEYATLPFAFNDGKAAIEGIDGLTQDGLGSDYNSTPKLKFDGTGDYLLLKFNEAPGTLSFDIKGNSFSGGTFKVQTSVNGTDFADLATYTGLGDTQSEEFNNLSSDVRYIKWIYANKASGNVALGNISLGKALPSITVDPITVEVAATPEAPETCFEGTLTITYANIPINSSEDFEIQMCDSEGSALTTEPEWVLVETAVENGSYLVSYVVEENTGAARTAYFKVRAFDAEANIVSSDLVTISQAAYVAPATGEQFRVFTGDLVEGDYIIYYDGKAMNNTVTNDRLQYAEVTPENDVITTSDASIVWHIAPSGDYWTIYSAAANAYAASTGGKNKAQMLAEGTDDKALWTVSGTETYEFVNKQNTASSVNSNLRSNGNYGFACYATSTGGALSLYKNVNDPVLTPTIDLTLTLNNDRYWGTFYNGGARYTLPEGAFAYTMNAAHQLYLLGEGTVIPANTAVIIIADNESITLSKSSETTTVSISGEGNILLGSNAPVAVSTVSGTPYVLGVVNGALGFYKYIGTAIPAAKAYYIVNE